MATATATKTAKGSTATSKSTSDTASPTASRLRPLGDRVVLRPRPGDEMTKSGIVIPDTVKEKPQEGEVLAVGPGRTLDDGSRDPVGLETGQRVLYAKYAGTEFKLDGEDLLIVAGKDILAVLEP
jgi:chaperonin GroES